MYVACQEALGAAGYEHYEVSSYALPGRRSRHNTLYWTMGAYLGLGVSAASFLPLRRGDGYRHANPRTLAAYQEATAALARPAEPEAADQVDARQLEEDALWLALRTADGVDRQAHQRVYGHDPLALPGRERAARACSEAGWLEVTPERLRLRPAGWLFADEVVVRLWQGPDSARRRVPSGR
jgi:oxygen-independent coproporphyrinogen-3 oxidase